MRIAAHRSCLSVDRLSHRLSHFTMKLFYNRAMRVTVGVSGGIAAYKAAELVRALQRQGLEVHVVMTAAACKFVQPLTFAALTGHKVITSLWDD